jgi:phage anti-repressor protein
VVVLNQPKRLGSTITQAEIDHADALVLASQLITISEEEIDGHLVETVDPRELHRILGVITRFNDWFSRRVDDYLFLEGIDFIGYSNLSKTKINDAIEYRISLDMAKELAMVEKNDIGHQIRRYFIDREKRYNNLVAIFIGDRRSTSRRFALEFFQEVSRVYGKKIPINDKHSPMMRGFVNRYVYRCLPEDVRQAYNEINPLMNGRRKYPIHQLLTIDMDHKFLKKRLELIIDFCSACGYGDSPSFKRMINTYDKNKRTKIQLPQSRQLILTPFEQPQLVLLPSIKGVSPYAG